MHKFSKFIHGTATLLPELVQAVPYWVDDESVRPSMLQSAPQPRQAMCARAPPPAAHTPVLRLSAHALHTRLCAPRRRALVCALRSPMCSTWLGS